MINISKLDYLLRPAPFYPLLRPLLEQSALRQWHKTRKPPAPLPVKAQIIRAYANKYRARIFVETGTFFGDMLAALRDDFDRLITIELDSALAAKARQRFRDEPKIRIIEGDSAVRLPEVVAELDRTALFWLDGHFSGGVTAKGNVDTPIIAELTAWLSAEAIKHVILIDDARLFGIARDYPSISVIEELVQSYQARCKMSVEMDIVRLEPGLP